MKRIPFGCLSVSGIIGGIITIAAILTAFAVSGGAIFSPGELNAVEGNSPKDGVLSHADLSQNCEACHTAFWDQERMQDRCLVCHDDVAEELADSTSMHASFMDLDTCRSCHREHRGATASLTDYDSISFSHDNVGFSLLAHQQEAITQQISCQSCHPQTVHEFDVNECLNCHAELDTDKMNIHIATYGAQCLNCHDGVDRYGANFDHAQTDYPLQGKHLELACQDCHPHTASVADLQSTPHACINCHSAADVHEGRLGTDCAQCHTPAGWGDATDIDHDLTRFPLHGAHVELSCDSCHINEQWSGLDTTCYGCHAQQDAHNGGFGTSCEACHQETNWEDVTFDHALSSFPLTGAHVNVACESCHVNAQFTGTSSACVSCHAEPAFHAGSFGTDCAACHSTSAWSPASFNLSHSFPLGHGGGTSCSTCHPNSFNSYTCYGCHEHSRDHVLREHQEEGISNIDNCVACHANGREGHGGHDD